MYNLLAARAPPKISMAAALKGFSSCARVTISKSHVLQDCRSARPDLTSTTVTADQSWDNESEPTGDAMCIAWRTIA